MMPPKTIATATRAATTFTVKLRLTAVKLIVLLFTFGLTSASDFSEAVAYASFRFSASSCDATTGDSTKESRVCNDTQSFPYSQVKIVTIP